MSLMKISGQQNNYPMVPIAMPAGSIFNLPVGQGVVGAFGGVNQPQLATNNPITGQFFLQLGQYTVLQMYDAGLNYWQNVNVAPWGLVTISSDGANFRVANSTGCPVGAVITNAGASYTNGFYGYSQFGAGQGPAITIQNGIVTAGQTYLTITPSAGASTWNAIVGGACSATMTFSGTVFNGNQGVNGAFGASTGGVTASGGTNYTKPPIIVFSPPANQGLQPYVLPTAICTISGGIINAITVIDQGCGLLSLPGVAVVNQPGDTTGGGAIIGWATAQTGSVGLGVGTGGGAILAMWPAAFGSAVTAVPTFTFSPASTTAATAIMNFSVTSITNTTPGVTYTGAYGLWQGGIVVATPATNTSQRYVQIISNPVFPQLAVAATTAVTTLAGVGQAAPFGGVNIQSVPTLAFGTQLAAGTVGTVAVQTAVVGGQNDVIKFQSF